MLRYNPDKNANGAQGAGIAQQVQPQPEQKAPPTRKTRDTLGPNAVHQRAELHQRRASGLAGQALQAITEMDTQALAIVELAGQQALDQRDAPAGGFRLVAIEPKGRAVRQAVTALDALICQPQKG